MSNNSPEDDRRDAETNRIAAEGNRMNAEDARVVSDSGRLAGSQERATRRKRVTRAQVVAYVLVSVVAAFGFYQIGQTQDDLCTTTESNREAIRNVVKAIDQLAGSLVADGRPKSELNPEELVALTLIEKFRVEQLALLDQGVCE